LPIDATSSRSITLETSDLGRGLTLTEVADTERVGRCRTVNAGTDLWEFGDPAVSMCLVLDGHMTAHAQGRRVASFGPGAIVGEMGFMTGNVRSATVTADVRSTLLEFEGLQSLAPGLQAKLHRNVALVMAERLVVTNEALAAVRG
jgi:SulP family sulfate permease